MAQPPMTRGDLRRLAGDVLGGVVREISAPGGRDRRSLRLHLEDGRSVIVTRREDAARGAHEAAFVSGLYRMGAPVPQVYGFSEGTMFHQDAGRFRLSHALMTTEDPERRAGMAASAIAALEDVRRVVEGQPDLLARLPALGDSTAWRAGFVARAFEVSALLDVAVPQVDRDALVARLIAPAHRFARWDARTGNAAVQPDGAVLWYDWEVFGRRSGVEDLAWLVADDYWPFDAEASARMLHPLADPDDLTLFVVLIAANRMRIIWSNLMREGWGDPDHILRHDRVGTTQAVIERVTRNAQSWAARDADLAGFVPWFDLVRARMLAFRPPAA